MRDYEDLVKSLRYCAEYGCTTVCPRAGTGNGCITRLKKEAADAIEELSRENRSLANTVNKADKILRNRSGKWISVKERLPKTFEPVIVCRKSTQAKTSYTVELGMRGLNGWLKVYGTRTKNVTHWLPLPEPPEGES